MSWIVVAYESKTGHVKQTFDIPCVPLSTLQEVFGICKSNPMYDCYLVTEKEKKLLEDLLGEKLGFELEPDVVYFLEHAGVA